MIQRFILDHIFALKKDKLFCPVIVFRRDMSNTICVSVLYLSNEVFNISWTYPGIIPFHYLKMVFAIQYSTLSLTGSQFFFESAIDRYEISAVNFEWTLTDVYQILVIVYQITCIGIFRTMKEIYDGGFLLLTVFTEKLHQRCLTVS